MKKRLKELAVGLLKSGPICGLERKPFHTQHAHVDENGGFWLEAECPACIDVLADFAATAIKEATKKVKKQRDGLLEVLDDLERNYPPDEIMRSPSWSGWVERMREAVKKARK